MTVLTSVYFCHAYFVFTFCFTFSSHVQTNAVRCVHLYTDILGRGERGAEKAAAVAYINWEICESIYIHCKVNKTVNVLEVVIVTKLANYKSFGSTINAM